MSFRESCVAVLTPPGRGAIAVVAAAGEAAERAIDAAFHAANGESLGDQTIGRIVFGEWQGEEVVVCRRSELATEVHCHGGPAAVERIVAAFLEAGCIRWTWQAWVEVQAEGKIAAEARAALAEATTRRAAGVLLDQLNGALQREVEAIAALIDGQSIDEAAARLERLDEQAELGLRLARGWKVVIAGRPNVGKSSLINALLGYERAIVFDRPGTTRDVVSATTALEGWPVQLSDVAGLRRSDDALEAAGVELAQRQIAQADLALWVYDAEELRESGREALAECVWQEYCKTPLLVANKIDLVPELNLGDSVLAASASTGEGVETLISAIALRLAPRAPAVGEGVVFTTRQRELVLVALNELRAGDCRRALACFRQLLND